MSTLTLSVVMAATMSPQESVVGVRDAIAAVLRSCAGLHANEDTGADADVHPDVIVVFSGADGARSVLARQFPAVHFESVAPGTLTPVMWGVGLRLARGDIVAFTSSEMRVSERWATALRRGFDAAPGRTVVGVGGPIAPAPMPHGAMDAIYFLRFSAYLPAQWSAPRVARDIPGDNAAYRRDAVLAHADLLAEGFWEVEFHRRFEREGLTLLMVPEAFATSAGSMTGVVAAEQRWTHGRLFGASRVARHGQSAVRIVLGAPLVPMVMMARVARRVLGTGQYVRRFALALPWLAVLTTAWAAGEGAGAVQA